jgi:hypothetical protein
MAGLDLFTIQDEIGAHIRATFPTYDVVDDVVIDDNYILRLDNNVKPFILLRWGSLLRSGSNTSFGGVRFDEYSSSVDVAIVAPNPRISRQAANMINDQLIGGKLSSGPAMIPTGGQATWAVNDSNGRPHLFVSSMRFNYAVNAESVGNNITP